MFVTFVELGGKARMEGTSGWMEAVLKPLQRSPSQDEYEVKVAETARMARAMFRQSDRNVEVA